MSGILNQMFLVSVLSAALISAVILMKAAFKNNIGIKAVSLLWALVLLRLLLPVTLQSPVYIGDVFTPKDSVHIAPLAEETATNEYENTGTAEADFIPNITSPAQSAEYHTTEANAPATSPTITKIKALTQKINFSAALAILWLSVCIGILAKGALNLYKFSSKLKSDTTVSKKLYDAYQGALAAISPHMQVRIIESTHVDMPVTYGLINPRIAIPKKMAEEIGSRKLQLIIMHELMHIKRLDIAKNYLWLLAKAVHWFNPLVWIGYKIYLGDMEIACDSKVMQKIDASQRAEYSDSLMDAAKLLNNKNTKNYPVVLNFCENKSKLRRRIMNILHPAKPKKTTGFVIGIITLVLLALCFTTACQKPMDEKLDNTNQPEETVDLPTDEPEQLNADISKLLEKNSSDYEIEDYQRYRDAGDAGVQTIAIGIESKYIYVPDAITFPSVKLSPIILDVYIAQKTADYFLDGDMYFPQITQYDIDLEINALKMDTANLDNLEYNQSFLDEVIGFMERDGNQPTENIKCEIKIDEYEYGKSFMAKSYNENGGIQNLQMSSNASGISSIIFHQNDFALGYSARGMREIATADINISEQSKSINAAYLLAKDAVDFFTDNMEISNVYVGKKLNNYLMSRYSEYDLYQKSDKICYTFLFSPIYDSVPTVTDLIMRNSKTIDDFYHNKPYSAEYIIITVDENGIGTFEWSRCSEIESINSDEYTVLSIDDAIEIFKANAFDGDIEWRQYYNLPEDTTGIEVGYLYFGMLEIDEYTVVPVYILKGNEYGPGIEYTDYTMIINAVDGSIIYQN